MQSCERPCGAYTTEVARKNWDVESRIVAGFAPSGEAPAPFPADGSKHVIARLRNVKGALEI